MMAPAKIRPLSRFAPSGATLIVDALPLPSKGRQQPAAVGSVGSEFDLGIQGRVVTTDNLLRRI